MFQAVNIIDYDQEAIFIVVDYFNGLPEMPARCYETSDPDARPEPEKG